MSHSIGLTPDPVRAVFRHVSRFFSEEDQDIMHLHNLPDGYNCHHDGLAIVVTEDAQQADDTGHARDLVRVSVYAPDLDLVRRVGRNIYTSLTQGVSGIGLGISRSRSSFFGSAPSYQPTGFVSTMSLSVGMGRIFATI